MKELHIQGGHDWTPLRELEARQAGHSVARGQGPPKQSAEFNVPKAAAVPLEQEPLASGGPVDP
eukprot:13890280-Heterocapsa_arctica.AAC.1